MYKGLSNPGNFECMRKWCDIGGFPKIWREIGGEVGVFAGDDGGVLRR